jgi:NADPH2:quinone reductase
MNKSFRAFRIDQTNDGVRGRVETIAWDDLAPNEVIIEGHYSSVNYKDALAGTGKGQILRRFPLTGGIDIAGTVVSAKAGGFHPGDPVIVTGCGIGETADGGYSEFISVPAASVVPLPKGLTLEESMILGTAGFTAALSLYRLEQNNQNPQKGPVVISGASGGVGSIATAILAGQGYEVWAISGKESARSFLEEAGARKVLNAQQLELGSRPLESVRFAGAIDNVGGEFLAGLLRHVDLWGNVACVGLAGSAEFQTTVMPFILRGVSLLGISSNNCPRDLRLELWKRLAGLWKPKHLKRIHSRTVSLDQLSDAFNSLLNRKATGRIVVDLRKRG